MREYMKGVCYESECVSYRVSGREREWEIVALFLLFLRVRKFLPNKGIETSSSSASSSSSAAAAASRDKKNLKAPPTFKK